MGRKKYADEGVMEQFTIKLPSSLIEKIEAYGLPHDQKKSTMGRNFLLLGLSMYESLEINGIKVDFQELAYRQSPFNSLSLLPVSPVSSKETGATDLEKLPLEDYMPKPNKKPN